MTKYLTFLFIMCASVYAIPDVNDFIDPNGGLDVAALMAALNDPNQIITTAEAEVKTPINIPFISQWLEQPKPIVEEYPKTQTFNISGNDNRIEWVFEDGKWIPKQTGTENSFFTAATQAELTTATLQYKDQNNKKHLIEITGKFRIKHTHYSYPSCDITGDGAVNLEDFAEFARTWDPTK